MKLRFLILICIAAFDPGVLLTVPGCFLGFFVILYLFCFLLAKLVGIKGPECPKLP